MYVGIQLVVLYKCNPQTNSLGTCAVDELLYGWQHQKSWTREASVPHLEKTQADMEFHRKYRKQEKTVAIGRHHNRTKHNGNVSCDTNDWTQESGVSVSD